MKIHQLYEDHKDLKDGEIVLDVRSKDEFNSGRIPGAINISHDEVEKHFDELKSYKRIYIHCRSGKRAQKAFQTLTQLGLTNLVCIDDSGMEQWTTHSYPTEK